jgi:hypothetical protein
MKDRNLSTAIRAILVTGFSICCSCVAESERYSVTDGDAPASRLDKAEMARLELGKALRSDLVALLHAPNATMHETMNGHDVEVMTWIRIGSFHRRPHWLFGHELAMSTLTGFVAEGMLVGYAFSSSFPSDRTHWDAERELRLTPGLTSDREVFSSLGDPDGYVKYPVLEDKGDIAAVYLENKPFLVAGRSIGFDGSGKVTGRNPDVAEAIERSMVQLDPDHLRDKAMALSLLLDQMGE